MKKHTSIVIMISAIVLIGISVHADDVSIDSSGNVTTGVNSLGNLEVFGGSGETGIFSLSDGTGAAAVRGEHTFSTNFGILGMEAHLSGFSTVVLLPAQKPGYCSRTRLLLACFAFEMKQIILTDS